MTLIVQVQFRKYFFLSEERVVKIKFSKWDPTDFPIYSFLLQSYLLDVPSVSMIIQFPCLTRNYHQLLLFSNSGLNEIKRSGVKRGAADGIYSIFSIDKKGKDGM